MQNSDCSSQRWLRPSFFRNTLIDFFVASAECVFEFSATATAEYLFISKNIREIFKWASAEFQFADHCAEVHAGRHVISLDEIPSKTVYIHPNYKNGREHDTREHRGNTFTNWGNDIAFVKFFFKYVEPNVYDIFMSPSIFDLRSISERALERQFHYTKRFAPMHFANFHSKANYFKANFPLRLDYEHSIRCFEYSSPWFWPTFYLLFFCILTRTRSSLPQMLVGCPPHDGAIIKTKNDEFGKGAGAPVRRRSAAFKH